ncbi:MAG: hypothetical protein ACLFNO_00725 [Parcubacteria group bacterium]
MTKFEDLKKNFIDNAPEYCNKHGLSILIDRLWQYHRTNDDRNKFISRLNKYQKNSTENEWYSLYAELHSLYLINKDLSDRDFAVFSKEENNDLILCKNSDNKNIEIKSILLKNFEKKYSALWGRLENISSGKAVEFEIKNFNKIDGAFKEVEELENRGISDYDGENIKIKVVQDINNKNKTALIGQVLVGWIPAEHLKNLIVRKIKDKDNQIEKADILIFYLHDSTYDIDDLQQVFKEVSNKLPIIKEKIVKCFTKWDGEKLIDIYL